MEQASKMQYLVSLPDKVIERVIELERLWGVGRDEVIISAIEYTYQSNHPLSDLQMDKYRDRKHNPTEAAASSLTMTLLQQTLDEGRTIRIPSLGITIGPREEE